jgi:hypothetical protein
MDNQILEHAEQRAALTTENEEQAKLVEAVRQAIGRNAYDTAKRVLPGIEQAINEDYQPFVAWVIAIAQKANKPISDQLRQWLQAIGTGCVSCPQSLRAGIAAYESLSFASIVWTDGRTIDENKRREAIGSIRMLLNSHDGQLSFLKSQKGQVESFIQQNDWPR